MGSPLPQEIDERRCWENGGLKVTRYERNHDSWVESLDTSEVRRAPMMLTSFGALFFALLMALRIVCMALASPFTQGRPEVGFLGVHYSKSELDTGLL